MAIANRPSPRSNAESRAAYPRRAHRSVALALAGALAGALALAACGVSPVRWLGPPMLVGAPLIEGGALAIHGTPPGSVRVAPQSVPAPRQGLPPLGVGACLASVRWSRATLRRTPGPPASPPEVAVAWWVARPDSSVVLRLARSADEGAHWEAPRLADSSDRGVRGCSRPAPAIAIDPHAGYTHLAYFIEPSTGAGVFYEHLMDMTPNARETPSPSARDVAMFHSPVAIVYGEIPAHTGLGAHGDTVVVAYEDPNRAISRIALAASLTAGHTFASSVSASGAGVAASLPLVAIDGPTVAVAWSESPIRTDVEGPPPAMRASRSVVRIGTLP